MRTVVREASFEREVGQEWPASAEADELLRGLEDWLARAPETELARCPKAGGWRRIGTVGRTDEEAAIVFFAVQGDRAVLYSLVVVPLEIELAA